MLGLSQTFILSNFCIAFVGLGLIMVVTHEKKHCVNQKNLSFLQLTLNRDTVSDTNELTSCLD